MSAVADFLETGNVENEIHASYYKNRIDTNLIKVLDHRITAN